MLEYNQEVCYGIKVEDFYYSEWNEEVDFNFVGHNLESLYENIVKAIIKETDNEKDFSSLINDKTKIEELDKKIKRLKSDIRQEKQFNKKVELNQKLRNLENEMEELTNE